MKTSVTGQGKNIKCCVLLRKLVAVTLIMMQQAYGEREYGLHKLENVDDDRRSGASQLKQMIARFAVASDSVQSHKETIWKEKYLK
jgi:hypothetical protein